MKTVKDIYVSAVIINNNSNNIINTLSTIQDTLIENYAHYEIVIIDTEESNETFSEEINGILTTVPKIRYIKLFNHPTKEVLFAAGIENAIGDIIITSIPEYYTKQNIINSVELCCNGIDTVYGILKNKKLYSNIVSNNINFVCVSRRIANSALLLPTYYNFIFYSLYIAGGKSSYIEINNPMKTNYISIFSKINNKLHIFLYNSNNLCKSIFKTYIIPLTILILSLIGINITLYLKTYELNSILLFSCNCGIFIVMFVFLCYSFYINMFLTKQILLKTNRQYTIMFEKHSSVMLNYNALNIRNNSISDSINLTQTGRDR